LSRFVLREMGMPFSDVEGDRPEANN
jgi:hypothetical protein